MMKLVDTKDKVDEFVEMDGLLDGRITHEIKSSSGSLKYIGPKINPEKWREVLAFFIWVNETTHSEAQVRTFYDPVAREIIFWAFPQEAGTGMTAKEIAGKDAEQQRANLPNAARLVPIGTVHSHCDAGAFQSGTDENDEKMVTGLHITIGHLSRDVLDFHARFYAKKGCRFEPDMSQFWDVSGLIKEIPDAVRSLIPASAFDKIARDQMCNRPAKDQSFPEQWRNNLIEVKKPASVTYTGVSNFTRDYGSQWNGSGFGKDPEFAIRDLMIELYNYKMDRAEVIRLLGELAGCNEVMEVFRVCVENEIMPDELLEEMNKNTGDKLLNEDFDPDMFGASQK